jgi:eukaryotic-like serine/threonine-protein kinase
MLSIGRYKLLCPLGAGGMAEVFLAQDAGVAGAERLVVVKRVLPALVKDDHFITMFINEARIATRLSHPHIAHVYEVGQHEGAYFLAMEFVHGADLGQILRRNKEHRLTPPQAVLVAARAAAALHHAHQLTDLQGQRLNIVHRDVSPQNIRISHEGIVKVLDFGIAKATSNAETTQSGVLKGKYPYMSPEQIDGLPLDGRSDVFSLGIVLHEMLTYRRLFKRESNIQTLKEISFGIIPTPSQVNGAQLPEALEAIVMRALQRDREARYTTAREMQRDLEAFLRAQPASESDLEELMTRLYGDASTLRRSLMQSMEPAKLQELLSHTPASSTLLPPASRIAVDRSATTMGSAASELTAGAPKPRRALWLAMALLGGVIIGGSTWLLGPWRAETKPPPVAAVGTVQPAAGTARPASTPRPSTPDAASSAPADSRARVAAVPRTPGRTSPKTAQRPKKAPAKLAADQARPPTPTEFGRLTLNTSPWAIVHIDGKKVGVTPIVEHRLSAGAHEVQLRNPDQNLSRTTRVEIPANGHVKKTLTLP